MPRKREDITVNITNRRISQFCIDCTENEKTCGYSIDNCPYVKEAGLYYSVKE